MLLLLAQSALCTSGFAIEVWASGETASKCGHSSGDLHYHWLHHHHHLMLIFFISQQFLMRTNGAKCKVINVSHKG